VWVIQSDRKEYNNYTGALSTGFEIFLVRFRSQLVMISTAVFEKDITRLLGGFPVSRGRVIKYRVPKAIGPTSRNNDVNTYCNKLRLNVQLPIRCV
jgi:hypothetical protein